MKGCFPPLPPSFVHFNVTVIPARTVDQLGLFLSQNNFIRVKHGFINIYTQYQASY